MAPNKQTLNKYRGLHQMNIRWQFLNVGSTNNQINTYAWNINHNQKPIDKTKVLVLNR